MSAASDSAPSSAEGAGDWVLGVAQSLSGKAWRWRARNDRLGLAIAQSHGVPEVVGRILAARGVPIDGVPAFLEPTLRDHLPDPSRLKDMDRAAERLAAAIMGRERIWVFGDYDVDGATSSAVLARFVRQAGGTIDIYIPDRIKEGYGPNEAALRQLRERGAGLVVTVDCGITAFAPLKAASDLGLDVIVVDHHEAEPVLPAAFAVVNPNRLDEDRSLGNLAAVGVAYLLAVATNRTLRQAGWYETRAEPDLLTALDLVAVGTVCDVVPLTGVNRALVSQGLKILARRTNAGLAALADAARVDRKPGAFHAGYLLGPRINAGGRVGESSLGADLLATDDEDVAQRIAARLDLFNLERQAIEAEVLERALDAAHREASPNLVFVSGDGWHPGVIGIVASRLKDRFDRPAVVVALDGGVGKGSGRSVPGIDLGAAVIAARQAGLLINGGGHKMAAGLTVSRENLRALAAFIDARIAAAGPVPAPAIGVDALIEARAANPALAKMLGALEPFGVGNAEPRFALAAMVLRDARIVGTNHVRCGFSGTDGSRLDGIWFRAAEHAAGQALLGGRDRLFHVAGHVRADSWQGRERVQLVIDDAADTVAAG